jgi:hypothetical protein
MAVSPTSALHSDVEGGSFQATVFLMRRNQMIKIVARSNKALLRHTPTDVARVFVAV